MPDPQPPAAGAPVYVLLGATGGIGSDLARRLAASGARLVLAARDAEKLRALASELAEAGHEAAAFTADATRPDGAEGVMAGAVERFGRVDGLANLVGSILVKPAHLTTPEEWRETMALNLDSAFFAVRAAAKAMPKGGSVVLMSSVAARVGLANHEAIAAAKAGVEGLVRAAAASYAPRGLRVNAVAPSLTRTPLAARFLSSEAAEAASAKMHPLGRVGEPGDIAAALHFLLDGAQSGWTTGQVFSVDGGMATVRGR